MIRSLRVFVALALAVLIFLSIYSPAARTECAGFGPITEPNVLWSLKDSVFSCPADDSLPPAIAHPSRLRIRVYYADADCNPRSGVPPESLWVLASPFPGSGNLKVNDQGARIYADDSTDASGMTRLTIPSFSGCGKVGIALYVSEVSQGSRTATVRTTDTDADGRTTSSDASPCDLNYDGVPGTTEDLQLLIPHLHHWRRQALHGTLVRRTNLCETCPAGSTNTIGSGDISWSPDGRWIAHSAHDSPPCRIKIVPSDPAYGNTVRNLTFDGAPADSEDYDPSWSPLGSIVIYHRGEALIYRKGVPGYAADTANVGIMAFTDPVTMTAVSPDGQTIAFTRFVSGQGRIFTIPVAGGTPRQLTTGAGFGDFYPKWSPDGQSLVFYRIDLASGQRKLYTVSVTDSTVGNPLLLYSPVGYAQYPAYSADGQIVTAGVGAAVTAPVTQAVDASGESPVTGISNYPGHTYAILSPRVSPDGTRLALLAKTPSNPAVISPQVWAARRNMNLPPQFTMIGSHVVADSDRTVSDAPTVGRQLAFQVAAADPEGDAPTYAAYYLRLGMTFDPVTRTFSWTPPSGTVGSTYYVKFFVATPSGGTDVIIDKLTVQACCGLSAAQALDGEPQVQIVGANPSSGVFVVSTNLVGGASVRLDVFDVAGRRIATLNGVAGRSLAWDGRDGAGRPVPTGVYPYRINIGGRVKSGRIAVVR